MTIEEIKIFHNKLVSHKSVQLLVLDSYADNFKPPTLPLALSEIFNAAFYQKPYADVIQECERLVKIGSFSVSQSQSDDVARFTIKQYKTPLWNRYRAGLSTASNSYAICHTSLKIPSQSLLKKICYPAKHHFSTEATRYISFKHFIHSSSINNVLSLLATV